jgi:hypothetical protein
MSAPNLKPGESLTETLSGMSQVDVELDQIIYSDGSEETRNDTVAAELKEEQRLAQEQREKDLAYDKAFSVTKPGLRMPQEEQIVRNYYSKLSFLLQLDVLSNAIMKRSSGRTDAKSRKLLGELAHFDLSEFHSGDYAEIESLPWTLLLNPDAPQGIIEVNGQGANIGINRHNFSDNWYVAAWSKSQMQPARQQQIREQIARAMRIAGASTVKDVVKLAYPGDWSRYASFTVHATLQGQAITYRATFLFAHQGEQVAPVDPVVRIPAGLSRPFYPTVLVDSVYRELPFIKIWVAEHQLSGCKKLKEPEVCCDASTDKCGLASEDLAHSLSLPIDENDRVALNGLMDSTAAAKKESDKPCPVLRDGDAKSQ